MSGTSSVSTAAGFIDLATFSELESFLYGGPHAISHFVAGVQKANWFTIVPIQLRNNGTFDFAQSSVSSSLNRSGDYVLNTWFRAEIPSVVFNDVGEDANPLNTVRWTRNLMHNLIRKVSITFNELVVEEFDNYWLDFNYMWRIPAQKRVGYKNMIGDVPTMINAINQATQFLQPNLAGGALWGGYFEVPLPFWYGEDTGIALPIAALPFNDVKINYEFRALDDLLVFNGPDTLTIADLTFVWPEFDINTGLITYTIDTNKNFRNGYTYAHYAVIHNDERVKMGDAPRDILIRQVQTVCGADATSGTPQFFYDVRLSHAIVSFFFAFRNKTYKGEWSNYTTNVNYGTTGGSGGNGFPQGSPGMSPFWDPIQHTALIYENTTRLWFDSDFYSLLHPYYFSDTVPDETGYHMWTYSPKPWDPLGPAGSTNYSKLANVQIRHQLSNRAQYYLGHTLTGTLQNGLTSFLKIHSVFVATNWNIARVANGSLGHPTL